MVTAHTLRAWFNAHPEETQATLAARAGVSQVTISRIVRGVRSPSPRLADTLARLTSPIEPGRPRATPRTFNRTPIVQVRAPATSWWTTAPRTGFTARAATEHESVPDGVDER
jgi:transcriptional regulator with XRE-family HTH domain